MTPSLIPLDAIDPEARSLEWRRAFEWHLDQVPPLMDTLSTLSVTLLRASRVDQIKVTGGGYIDNVPVSDRSAGVDADELWTWLVAYTRAVVAWIEPQLQPDDRPSIANDPRTWTAVAPRPDADPLSARTVALLTIGWLIDHAGLIEPIRELDAHAETMFKLIRKLRGIHRGGSVARRQRPRVCGVCGECAVLVDWVDGANGSPKPVQVGRCKVCGQTYATAATADTNQQDRSTR
ncbi:hypothetical protein [Microbacterium imperiale]|uniref:Uncharacterized protein n=1 Tax=Microbacterium imperiale TaxID=33884 RepID=A0A9W6HDL9_9MICO|nr:hypothetical protein [Microbacterium imperiale]MBP2420033.1 hypothetical protein [Microbacterium imperiale]MDS0198104.1 hypothetical protein [Microbacterium imperiale]BFE40374.1 hypothetical protein GCM10017544_13300 [Microbacterium imperiale]GLJ78650.1 hypothetical protein GCM10017586_03320 [Microbacterium imperiale]